MAYLFKIEAYNDDKPPKKLGEETIMHPETFKECILFLKGLLTRDTGVVDSVDPYESAIVKDYMAHVIVKIQAKLRTRSNGQRKPRGKRGEARAAALFKQRNKASGDSK